MRLFLKPEYGLFIYKLTHLKEPAQWLIGSPSKKFTDGKQTEATPPLSARLQGETHKFWQFNIAVIFFKLRVKTYSCRISDNRGCETGCR